MKARGNTAEQGKSSNGWDQELGEKLWEAAEKLRGQMDAGDYMPVVLGLIFLKYLSDAFTRRYAELLRLAADPDSRYYVREPAELYRVLENHESYLAENICWVPAKARWNFLRWNAKLPTIGKIIDEAMAAIEVENPRLTQVLPKGYSHPKLDKQRLGDLVQLIGGIGLAEVKDDEVAAGGLEVFARVYEYFLAKFTVVEGNTVVDYSTPPWLLRMLVEMPAADHGRIYDPCCGLGGTLVQSWQLLFSHGGTLGDFTLYGQEMNYKVWRLCRMNLAIRGLEAEITCGNTLHDDRQKELKADVILANPPLNVSDWGGERRVSDVRWRYGTPPLNDASFAWVQHLLHHLAPDGIAGIVLAARSLSSDQNGEGSIRKALVEADLVDCIVMLPGRLAHASTLPLCLWFLTRGKIHGTSRRRRGEVLFIDARKLRTPGDLLHRELADGEITRLVTLYHAWRDGNNSGNYTHIPGLCKSVFLEEIRRHNYVLAPARYVADEDIDDYELFADKLPRLQARLEVQLAESERLGQVIVDNLRTLGLEKVSQ